MRTAKCWASTPSRSPTLKELVLPFPQMWSSSSSMKSLHRSMRRVKMMATKEIPRADLCIFCSIVARRHPQRDFIVYQDQIATVFFDHIQPHYGHLLVVPNRHRENI